MSLLLPDYSSSSDDEGDQRSININATSITNTTVTSSAENVLKTQSPTNLPTKTPSNTKKRKNKTTLHLPPVIQRLLESGATLDSDGDDDEELDANHILRKRQEAVDKRRKMTNTTDTVSALSFLPPPKNSLPVPVKPTATRETESKHSENAYMAAGTPSPATFTSAAYESPASHEMNYEAEPSVRPPRARDRELERLLQQGHFEQVANSIVDVHGPAPDAWEAPVKEPETTSAHFQLAMRPSRLQRQRHQLNQLTFDAVTREAELLERKGNALKTKRETYAKYGW